VPTGYLTHCHALVCAACALAAPSALASASIYTAGQPGAGHHQNPSSTVSITISRRRRSSILCQCQVAFFFFAVLPRSAPRPARRRSKGKDDGGDGRRGAGAVRRGEGAGGGHAQGARGVPALRRGRGGRRRGERAPLPRPAAVPPEQAQVLLHPLPPPARHPLQLRAQERATLRYTCTPRSLLAKRPPARPSPMTKAPVATARSASWNFDKN
jgi:hypothetical protein